MYSYHHHPMTSRDKEGVLIGLSIRTMVDFRKIFDVRKAQCRNPKRHDELMDIGEEVIGGFLNNLTMDLIVRTQQYTRELHAMDVSELFTKPVPEPVIQEKTQRREKENEYMLGHPEHARFYSFRRNTKNRTKPSGERAVMDTFHKARLVPAYS